MIEDKPMDVIVVGAGQSGLATGYYLRERDVTFRIVHADDRVGDTWRDRWDSLRLFTPAFYDGLPGMDFPAADPEYLPTKDEVADYLETYADRFELPVTGNTRVESLERDGEDARFRLSTTAGDDIHTDRVVVATGAHSTPAIPEFADELPPDVFTCHSSSYRNPEQLEAGDVLVVGAANSGTQIAAEIAADEPERRVVLAGPDTGRLPRRLLGRDIYRFLAPTLLRIDRSSFLGRRIHDRVAHGGDPVFEPQAAAMEAAGVERVGRITGVADGSPRTAEGERLAVENVVWATGFRPGFDWIDLPIFEPDGQPRHDRGVANDVQGLGFVGLHWQTRASSSLIGGVASDAKHIAGEVATTA